MTRLDSKTPPQDQASAFVVIYSYSIVKMERELRDFMLLLGLKGLYRRLVGS